MEQLLDLQWVNYVSTHLTTLMLTAFLEGVIFFTLISSIMLLHKKLPSEFKHKLWFVVICVFIVMPVVTIFIPSIDMELFRPQDKNTGPSGQLTPFGFTGPSLFC